MFVEGYRPGRQSSSLALLSPSHDHVRMADECIHGLTATQCVICQSPPSGFPTRVWITKEGTAFHLRRDCKALLAGQRYAERRGQATHEPENVAYKVAEADGRDPCVHCFPQPIPPDARPCWVRVDGRWLKGWVLGQFKGDDQRWKAKVGYLDKDRGVRRTTIKDESDLKRRASGTNDPPGAED
jgi:hypothetical protein